MCLSFSPPLSPLLQEMAALDGTLRILRTKYRPLWPGEGWDFRHTSILFREGPCPFFLLSFEFNFQIPMAERQGAQPQSLEFWIYLEVKGMLTAEQ